jgi:CMP-N,N'-diacetyllegionaminic acid synthase
MEDSHLAIIPARGGSKGIPRKNIVSLNGAPLMSYTINAALASKSVSRVIVSSEDEEILDISVSYGADVIKRPLELAGDDTSAEAVIFHCLDTLQKEEHFIPESFVLLQPTSPLRTFRHIDEAAKFFIENSSQAVISVFESIHHPLKSLKIDECGCLAGLINDEYVSAPRQQLPKAYTPNGAIYIITTAIFRKYRTLLPPETVPYFMPKSDSVDVDDMDDLDYVAFLMKKRTP